MANIDDDDMLQVHEVLLFLHMPQVCASLFVCIDFCLVAMAMECALCPIRNYKIKKKKKREDHVELNAVNAIIDKCKSGNKAMRITG